MAANCFKNLEVWEKSKMQRKKFFYSYVLWASFSETKKMNHQKNTFMLTSVNVSASDTGGEIAWTMELVLFCVVHF